MKSLTTCVFHQIVPQRTCGPEGELYLSSPREDALEKQLVGLFIERYSGDAGSNLAMSILSADSSAPVNMEALHNSLSPW